MDVEATLLNVHILVIFIHFSLECIVACCIHSGPRQTVPVIDDLLREEILLYL